MTELSNKTTTIRLNVLGRLEIIREGEPIQLPTNKRACHLLAMLAFKKTYDLQELVSVFWDGEHLHHEDPKEVKRVLDNLAQIFTAVRQTLDIETTILKSDGTTLRWIENECYLLSSDADDFRRFARSATSEDQQAALALVRGKVAEHIPVERKLTDSFFEPDRQEQREEIKKLLRQLEPGTSDEAVLNRRVWHVLNGKYREDMHEAGQDGEVGPLPPAPATVTRGRMPYAARLRRLIVGALAGCVALGIAVWALWPDTSHMLAVPRPGSVVDAQTGRVVRFTPTSHLAKLEPTEAEVLLWVCDLSAKQPCTYPKTTHPLVAHRGDVLEVWVRLYDEEPTPIALLGVSVGWFYTYETARRPSEPFSAKQVFNVADAAYDWPGGKKLNRGTGMALYVQMLPQGEGITYLPSYIPGSTELSSLEPSFHHPLPDGILQHEELEDDASPTKHIWLSNVGAPPAVCAECRSQYIRFINFRLRML